MQLPASRAHGGNRKTVTPPTWRRREADVAADEMPTFGGRKADTKPARSRRDADTKPTAEVTMAVEAAS
jgi:hypothetical protein